MTDEVSAADRARVRELLGREPLGSYDVVVRDESGDPVVLRNAPLLDDGTPMPTRYWLVGTAEIRRMGQLESLGGVDRAEAEIDPGELAAAHLRYAAERDALLPADHAGPRPSGGVGGTRTGVKCLHAHWAWHLAGGNDPVGRWIEGRLATTVITIGDTSTAVAVGVGPTAVLPWGVVNLTERWLSESDPPHPADLTNALGTITDHLDDADRALPGCGRGPVELAGSAATALARLEVGADEVPAALALTRGAADEVFRMVATEPAADRAHNPGLPLAAVPTIVATCCIVLAVMRRYALDDITVRTGS